jgi:hypothetical protein
MTQSPINTLADSLGHLRRSPALAAAIELMTRHATAIAEALAQAMRAEVPAFSESRNPEILPLFAQHGTRQTTEILRMLDSGTVGDFEFVREHARRTAEQYFPLEATLHAYRSGHKVFSHWMRESMLPFASSADDAQRLVAAVADFAIEHTNTISTIVADAYSAHARLIADVAGDQRAQLLNILLQGYDEADGRVAKILRDAGYLEKRHSFCVALARSVDPAEMLNAARARRLADSIEQIVQESRVRRLIDLRDHKVIMVFSDTRRESGWSAPRSSLAERISSALALVGNAVLIGVSNDVPSTSHIPSAHREASTALEFAEVTRRVVRFPEISLQRLSLHFAGEEFRRVLPAWAAAYLTANDSSRGALTATLRGYASADMNVLQAADALNVHPNTIYARFQRIFEITGLQARSYNALTELLIVTDCARGSFASASGPAEGGPALKLP